MRAQMRALLRAVFVAGLLIFCPAVSAYASVGVGIQADPVRLAGVARPGGTYDLPAVYVVNTGSQTESISIAVQRIAAAKATWDVPGSWIQALDVPGQLAPGQAARIPLRLVTPADARQGRYSSDVVVTASVAADPDSPVRFGAAAETGLEFTVGPARPGGYPVWKIWLLVAVVLAVAAGLVARYSGLRIRIERQ